MKHTVRFTARGSGASITPALRSRIKRAVAYTLTAENFPYPAQVFVSVVDPQEIARLNGQYRNKPQPTDVLSFPVLDSVEDITDADRDFSRGGEVLLGDVILCAQVIAEQAGRFGHSFEQECVYMTVHSVLHLLGYDHILPQERQRHFARQDCIYSEIEKEENK